MNRISTLLLVASAAPAGYAVETGLRALLLPAPVLAALAVSTAGVLAQGLLR